MKIVMLGAPGVGKGTQAELLCRRHQWAHLSTGEMLRGAVEAGSPLGLRAKDAMSRGDLVEDAVILGLIAETLDKGQGKGFVLDGFPRTMAQAKGLDKMLDEKGARLDRVVLLSASDEEVMKRLAARGRADDTPETVRHRLSVYVKSTKPLIDYYEPKGLLRRVDGVGSIPEIGERIEAALES